MNFWDYTEHHIQRFVAAWPTGGTGHFSVGPKSFHCVDPNDLSAEDPYRKGYVQCKSSINVTFC